MGPTDEDQSGGVAGSATRLGLGDPGTAHWVWLPSPPRKLPVLSDLLTREALESRSSVFTGAASTMDTSWALLLFLFLGKSPAQPLPTCSPSRDLLNTLPSSPCSLRKRGPHPWSLFWSSANQFLLGLRKLFPGPRFKSLLHQPPQLETSRSVSRFKCHGCYPSSQMVFRGLKF